MIPEESPRLVPLSGTTISEEDAEELAQALARLLRAWWLRQQATLGKSDGGGSTGDLMNEVNALTRERGELRQILDKHRVTYPDKLGHWICEPEIEHLEQQVRELRAEVEKLKAMKCRECGEAIHDDDEPDDVFHRACLDPMVERLTLADRQWADHFKRLAEENERLRAALNRHHVPGFGCAVCGGGPREP